MRLTHTDEQGAARMVDVGGKPVSTREAVAEGHVRMSAEAFELVQGNAVAKGDVLAIARIAGIAGAKRTSDLVPLCHPIALDLVEVDTEADASLPGVRVRARTRATARTGRRDGSAGGRHGRVPDGVRHGEGSRSLYAHRGCAAALENRWNTGRLDRPRRRLTYKWRPTCKPTRKPRAHGRAW